MSLSGRCELRKSVERDIRNNKWKEDQMGAVKSKLPGVDKIKGKRGSVNNKRRLDAFENDRLTEGADWGGCDAAKMQTVVRMITELGGAVTFGMSRDNGAYSLTLMLDSSRKTLWFNGDSDLNEDLEGVAATLDTLS